MKRILVRSVYDAFEYVMKHYWPAELEEFAEAKDTYAVISIQDTHTGGFGVAFTESRTCKGVLTLYFDDIIRPVEGYVLFSEDHARQVIDFIREHRSAETLLIHCYAGQSRSRAVGAFALKMLGGDNRKYFEDNRLNEHVYQTLLRVFENGTEKDRD